MKTKEELNTMLTAMIAGEDTSAKVTFHGIAQEKIKGILYPVAPTEDDVKDVTLDSDKV